MISGSSLNVGAISCAPVTLDTLLWSAAIDRWTIEGGPEWFTVERRYCESCRDDITDYPTRKRYCDTCTIERNAESMRKAHARHEMKRETQTRERACA